MNQAPEKRVCGAPRREFPHDEIACPPHAMPNDRRERTRTEHKMPEILVEGEKVPGREKKANQPHLPVRQSRLQDHRGNPNVLAAKAPPEKREVLPEAARHWKWKPAGRLHGKFGNHDEGKFREEPLHLLDRSRDQRLLGGSEQDLDLLAQRETQISGCRRASNEEFLRSSHSASACRQKAVDTGFTNGRGWFALRPNQNPPVMCESEEVI